MQTAKLFKNGRSQAVRLPKDFRLPGDKAVISHIGNAILLQPVTQSWLEVYHQMSDLANFMEEREDLPPQERESF